MRTIKVKKNNWHLSEYKKDINFIQDSLLDKGFFATSEQCAELWEMHSENEWAAEWIAVSGDRDYIFKCLQKYFEPGPEGSVDTRYL